MNIEHRTTFLNWVILMDSHHEQEMDFWVSIWISLQGISLKDCWGEFFGSILKGFHVLRNVVFKIR